MLHAQLAPAEVVDQALVLGKKYFWTLLRLGCFPMIAANQATHMARLSGVLSSVQGIGLTLFAYALTALAEAAMVVGAWQVLHSESAGARDVWIKVVQNALSIAIAYTLKVVMLSLGFVLLLLPGIYLWTLYFAVPGVMAIEDLGVRAGFARSRALAHGAMMHIFLAVGLFWLITVLISIVLPLTLPHFGTPFIVTRLTILVWVLLVSPFRAALVAIAYANLRVSREGYDLDLLLSDLPGTA